MIAFHTSFVNGVPSLTQWTAVWMGLLFAWRYAWAVGMALRRSASDALDPTHTKTSRPASRMKTSFESRSVTLMSPRFASEQVSEPDASESL